jgi:predicted amidohydrolase
VSSDCQVSDYSDLFCELFDGLSESEFRAAGEGWVLNPDVLDLAREVEAKAVDGTLSAADLRRRIESAPTGERQRTRFALLRGLDAALGHANPLLTDVAPAPLSEYAFRYAESGRFDSGAIAGGLLPRFARPGRRGQLPDDLADAFGSVVRVPADAWAACDHLTLPTQARLTRVDRDGGLRIATTPLIRDPDELRWEVHERAGLRFYRVRPADLEPTERRIEQVVKGWDQLGASIGIAPELCLSPRLLDRWQAALTGRESAERSALRLVLAGSGNVERAEPPANAAVLLDALTGEVLVRQRKIHPFNFSPADVELWGLGDRLEAPIDEDLSRGESLCVIEAGGTRLVILVCEDLARLHAFSAAIHAHGVSLILVPVFARPTKDRRWERAKAEVYSDATGSSVVVANSLVVAAVLGMPERTGTAIAVAPGEAAVGHAAEPDDVIVFTLDAGSPTVAHERTAEASA